MKQILLLLLYTPLLATAQSISVNPNDYNQEFLGTGASCGLYYGHYFSMSEENQLKNSEMLFKDLKLEYVKEYQGEYPWEDPNTYDKIAKIVENARLYNPNVKFVNCVNNLPDHLEEKDANGDPIKGEHNESLPGIMDSVAHYYFQVCKGFHDRGVTVEILELVNERGYDDGKVTDLFDKAASKFKALINDTAYNVTNVPMPLIGGPSSWSASSPKKFINGWKADRPNAWANCDIAMTHGYQEGTYESYKSTYDVSDGKLFYQSEQTGKLQRDEDKGVDVLADQFPDDGYSPSHIANLVISRQMIDFFNAGGNAFFAFLTNNPTGSNAALTGTKWGKSKVPFESTMYNGFKHLSATQPLHSKRLTSTLTGMDNFKVIAFRKEGEDEAYLHILNLYDNYESVNIDFQNAGIKGYEAWMSNSEGLGFEKSANETFSASVSSTVVSLDPYSIITLKVQLDTDGPDLVLQSQSITFPPISDKKENDATFELQATSTSGDAVSYEVIDGPATINGTMLSVEGIGKVTVKAMQAGNETYGTAPEVVQSFKVWPAGTNVALNGTATAGSVFNSTYTPDKAIDGDKTSNSSRWLTARNDTFPQIFEIDLGETKNVNAVAIYTGFDGNYENAFYDFDFQVSIGTAWISKVKESLNKDAEYLAGFDYFPTSKVRLVINSAPEEYIARVYEIEVYEKYEETSAINDHKTTDHISVYPNPANDHISIEGLKVGSEIKVYNLSGQCVLSEYYNKYLNVSDLTPGMYLLKTENSDIHKFIKN